MPQKTCIDFEKLANDLRKLLMNRPMSGVDVRQNLKVSQSTFSRVLAQLTDDILVAGKSRNTRYALRRAIPEVGLTVPIYQINMDGKTSKWSELHSIYPRGFYLDAFFTDLPYFLDDLRPNGFLGRLIPPLHPELNLPKNIVDWSANDCLKYLTRYGSDLIGNLIIGDESFGRYLEKNRSAPDYVPKEKRDIEYPKIASQVLQHGDPGSSAGGEQPKFSTVVGPDLTPVLVKFSPIVDSNVSQRLADLLICEHISLTILKKYGQSAAASTLIHGGNRIFLETERFDRTGVQGRRGIVSLGALNNEFVGKTESWILIASELLKQDRITQSTFNEVRWRELFGHLIANTDMHLANISFFFQSPDILGLAPAYDMLPMLYAPQNGQIIERNFKPMLPTPGDADIWEDVWSAGKEFWAAVAEDARISPEFQKIAQENLGKFQSLDHLIHLLP